MPNLKIVNVLPNTRVAVFKGSGNRNYTDEDIIFLNEHHVYQINLNNLPEGDYFVRTIHREYIFENIDVDLSEDRIVRIKNKIDPNSVSSVEHTKYLLEDYIEVADSIVGKSGADLNSDNPISESLSKELITEYLRIRDKFHLSTPR